MNGLSLSATCSFWLIYYDHRDLGDYNTRSCCTDGETQKLVLQTVPIRSAIVLLTREETLLYKNHLILWRVIDKNPA
ncbi:hypothetical protein EUGRSUZ_G03280 [Eucalyptus grandis]|uniref:Uncharacterized protein n=2 Tax=Eucalyptus grandis TaxID=71139 RepID=A0ACC3K9Z8_EUCGR|nr:hypothetical protein EUGRSUZ_G03280 [Eucalyptus grandis]